MSSEPLAAEITATGRRLARASRAGSPLESIQDRGMAWLTRRQELRAALFRTVDVAPACATPAELSQHLAAHLPAGRLQGVVSSGPGRRLAGRVAETAVAQMAQRFIIAEDIAAAAPAIGALWSSGIGATVDLLGEATVTRAEGDAYAARCLDVLETLANASSTWPSRPLLEGDAAGSLPRTNLSVKVTALTPLIRPAAPERGRADAEVHLLTLLRRARDLNAHLHIDMESLDSRELIVDLVLDLLARPEFADGPSVGVVVQAYLRDAPELVGRLLAAVSAIGRSVPLTVRLVKGAYWDHESIQAAQNGWPVPVWSTKAESDRCFEQLTRRLLDAYPLVRTAVASHNLRSVAHALVYARRRGLADADLEFQVLRGLGDDLARGLAAEGLRCRVYEPVGDIVAGMAYLVRRLLENSANDSFLANRAGGLGLRRLLAAP